MSCSPEPCILWGVSSVLFGIGCFLVVLAIFARFVILLLLGLINLALKRWDKHDWCDPMSKALYFPTTWFLRIGCIFGAFILFAPTPFNGIPAAVIVFYIVGVPFCLVWLWWTFVFLKVVADLVVDEFELKESKKLHARMAKRRALGESSSSMLNFKSSVVQHKEKGKVGKPTSARATSLSQVLLIFRVIIEIMILLICCSILEINFAELLNRTSMWWLVIVLALIPHLRSIYLGVMYLFLYTDDDWNCTHLSNVALLNRAPYITGEPSLARVKLRSLADDSLLIAPLNYYTDQFGMSESRFKIVEIPLALRLGLKHEITAADLRSCLLLVTQYLEAVHPALSLHSTRNPRSGVVTIDTEHWDIRILCSMFTFCDSAAILRAEIMAGLIELVRPWYRESDRDAVHMRNGNLPFLQSVPESKYPNPTNDYNYIMLATPFDYCNSDRSSTMIS